MAIHPGEGSLLRKVEILAHHWHFLSSVVDTGHNRLHVVGVVIALHFDDFTSRSGVSIRSLVDSDILDLGPKSTSHHRVV